MVGGSGALNGQSNPCFHFLSVRFASLIRFGMEPLDATSDASFSGLVASLSERYDPSNADHMAALRQLWELAWPGTPWQAAAGESSEVSPCGLRVERDGSLCGSLAAASQ